MNSGPALVSILRQGDTLVASVHTALDDSEMIRFQHDLVRQIGEHRARGVIIDVAALDVIDSFASRTFRSIASLFSALLLLVCFFVLGYLGVQAPSPVGNLVSQIGTLLYFGFFLLMPWWSRLGTFKPVPDRVTYAAH